MNLTLAVLSDLHVGRGTRASDLCPYDDPNTSDDNYTETFEKFARSVNETIDYLILPGDVSHTAQPVEVELASATVLRIASAFSVPESRIRFVPGNHDVDWEVFRKPDPTGLRRRQRYDPIRSPNWVFERILRTGTPYLLDAGSFTIWADPALMVVGYNSAADDDPERAKHPGFVHPGHLDQLSVVLDAQTFDPNQLRLLLVHHHPFQYTNPIPTDRDFSIMVNAEALFTLLQQYRFDFIIHGHRHAPCFHTLSLDTGHPVAVLSAGSFSASLDIRWAGRVSNQFHVIRVTDRESQTGVVRGTIKSWSYLCGKGWVRSGNWAGIRHMSSFGSYALPEILKRTLRARLDTAFQHKHYTRWSVLTQGDEQLQYLPEKTVWDILKELGDELHFSLVQTEDDDIVLLKEESSVYTPGPRPPRPL